MKKKILVVVDSLNGGAGNMAQILVKYLSQSSDVNLLLMNYVESNIKYGVNEKIILKFDSGKTKKIRYIIKAINYLKKLFKHNKYDVVVSFLDNNNTLCGLSLYFNKKVKLIVSERSNPLVIMPSNKMWTILRRIAYKRADYVSVQFDEFKTFDNSRFLNKCVETPNIILPAPVKRQSKNDGVVKFVSCARFAQIKRFDLMIKLFKKVNDSNPNTELYICGDGPEKDKIINLINELELINSVKLLGKTNDVYNVLKECDVYLMTSEQEGFPNALSEALAVGLSAVVFKCHDGISKLVVNDFNGFCINDGDENGFVDKCVQLSNDYQLINSFGKNSIEIADKYNPEKVLEVWNKIIF